ncbi:glycosyltransferase [Virgibacillus sp. DJP39]|uniref:glycosyltransferase n=1 Tax=Virgibacillus sp. DJP39 TaxID=3409790 RepID=UPI003BB4F61D
MKKKILFMLINMNVGGTEKALLNMISEMPKSDYDITILMLEEYGGFLDSIPNDVHVEYVKEYNDLMDVLNKPPKEVAINLLKKGKIRSGVGLLFTYVLSKLVKSKSIFFKYILKDVPNFISEYDVAVAYAGPMDFISYFVIHKIKAKRKIQWIHFDIGKIDFDTNFATKLYREFDKLFVVSDEGRSRLVKRLPELLNKVDTFHNIISPQSLLKKADEGIGFNDQFKGIRILTVGRLSKEKGQDLIITVLANLKENGFNVRWYCIGEGNERDKYEELITKYKVKEDFILLGASPNPYPFMKECDIYVQPSRHEGYCITLAEAKCFDNPIVSTNFTGAKEQLSNNKLGLIVKFDEREMVDALMKLLNDDNHRSLCREGLHKENINNTKEINKLIGIANVT